MMANEEGDKTTMRGYVYLMDDGRDLKLGITGNMKNRLRDYITENPRLKVHDSYEVDSFKQAEDVEKELIEATKDYRTHGNEWCEHCEEVFDIWENISYRYARRTLIEWNKRRPKKSFSELLELIIKDLKEKLEKEPDDKKYFHYDGHGDITICHSDYFDGTERSARLLVQEAYRKKHDVERQRRDEIQREADYHKQQKRWRESEGDGGLGFDVF